MRRQEDRFPVRRDRAWGLSPWREGDAFGPSSFDVSPWQSMRRMQEDMDRLFNLFFGGGQPGQAGAQGQGGPQGQAGLAKTGQQQSILQWAPSVDISETSGEWNIEVELPGVNRDDIDVQVQDGYLILSAETRQESEQQPQTGQGAQGRQYHRRERRYGYFQRVIPLPENVNEDQITCSFRSGVLNLRLPKTEPTRPQARRIAIQDVEQIPSETASGRTRTRAELDMTEDTEEDRAMAGAKGGATSSGSSAAARASGTRGGSSSSQKSGSRGNSSSQGGSGAKSRGGSRSTRDKTEPTG